MCVKVSANGRSVHLLHLDTSGGAYDISYDAWNYLNIGKSARSSLVSIERSDFGRLAMAEMLILPSATSLLALISSALRTLSPGWVFRIFLMEQVSFRLLFRWWILLSSCEHIDYHVCDVSCIYVSGQPSIIE